MIPNDFETLLKQMIGLDAASVGSATVERAVRLRMAGLGVEQREDYWRELENSPSERQEFIEAVVVPETWFFRDPEAFATLARLAAEEWRPFATAAPLRVLSIRCSTGEEPYSIVMALLDGGFSLDEMVVDAMDISERALSRARRGVYGSNSFRGQELGFRERYFRAVENGYALVDQVRDKVAFRQENLVSPDAPLNEKPYDVVFCRNVLIYFDRVTQAQAMRRLRSLLGPSGLLFVGPAEAFLASCSGFASVNHPMSFAFRVNESQPPKPAGVFHGAPAKPAKERPRPQIQRAVKAVCMPVHSAAPVAVTDGLETARPGGRGATSGKPAKHVVPFATARRVSRRDT